METTELHPDDQPPAPRPRRTSRGLLWAVGLAVVVLGVATFVAFRAGDGADTAVDPSGFDGAGLEGTDPTGEQLRPSTYETFAGEERTLTTDGRPLLVNFWSSTCIPCVKEMPAIEQVYLANAGTVDVLGIQVAEGADQGEAMIARTGVTYPVARDPKGDVFRSVGGTYLPRTILVDADGTIVAAHTGEVTRAELQAMIDDDLPT